MNNKKCSVVSVIGRPSVGKSTFINTVCETKVSITSSVPQTTRNIIKGVYTDKRGQLIFIDTPGLHNSEKSFNQHLKKITVNAVDDSDIILYILDGTRKPAEEEKQIVDYIKHQTKPLVICINKSDTMSDKDKEFYTAFISDNFSLTNNHAVVLFCSALEDEGIDEVLIELFEKAKVGNLLYSEDVRTDQDLKFRIAEIVREKAMNNTSEEIPHSLTAFVEEMDYYEDRKEVFIRIFIYVLTESQKAVLIGKNGTMIKNIRIQSFKEIKKIFSGMKLTLDIRVKVNKMWKKHF